MHIGIIGGIGPAATVFYYERIVAQLALSNITPALTIAHSSALMLSRNVTAGNQQAQSEEFLRISQRLADAGADALVISSMGGHFCADTFVPMSPLPLISGPHAVAAYLKAEGISRIGILGTRVVMQTGLYGALDGIEAVTPQGDALTLVNDDYIAIAVTGAANDTQRDRLVRAGRHLVQKQGAQAVLLGGTDLNVAYNGVECDFRVIDSAQIHVDAIVEAILANASG